MPAQGAVWYQRLRSGYACLERPYISTSGNSQHVPRRRKRFIHQTEYRTAGVGTVHNNETQLDPIMQHTVKHPNTCPCGRGGRRRRREFNRKIRSCKFTHIQRESENVQSVIKPASSSPGQASQREIRNTHTMQITPEIRICRSHSEYADNTRQNYCLMELVRCDQKWPTEHT